MATELSIGFPFEVRLWWQHSTAGDDGWLTAAWCATREYAELLAEASMSRPGCGCAEVWGPSQRVPGTWVALLRYDHGAPDDR